MAFRDPGRADRIIDSARELVDRYGFRGVSIAEIAEHAGIGKGTIYLHWPTKEAIFVELIARSVATFVERLVVEIGFDARVALPDRCVPRILVYAMEDPVVRALQASDGELLRAIARDPRAQELLDRQDPGRMVGRLIPVWRECGVLDSGQRPEDQAYAFQVIVLGAREMALRGWTMSPAGGVEADLHALGGLLRQALRVRPVSAELAETMAAGVVDALRHSISPLSRADGGQK